MSSLTLNREISSAWIAAFSGSCVVQKETHILVFQTEQPKPKEVSLITWQYYKILLGLYAMKP